METYLDMTIIIIVIILKIKIIIIILIEVHLYLSKEILLLYVSLFLKCHLNAHIAATLK